MKNLLDKLKEGQDFSYEQITAALIASGDLDGRMEAGVRGQGMDQQMESPAREEWHQAGKFMVVKGYLEDCRDPRPWCSAYLASRYETSGL